MSDVLEILKRGDSGLEALLRAVLLDSDNKVPAERLRIVGALADGAIMESGSNSNGRWCKLADGTQVCYWSRGNLPITSNTGIGFITGLYRYNIEITFPAAFVTIPAIFASGASNSSSYAISDVFTASRQGATLIHYTQVQTLPGEATLSWCAIGKWK